MNSSFIDQKTFNDYMLNKEIESLKIQLINFFYQHKNTEWSYDEIRCLNNINDWDDVYLEIVLKKLVKFHIITYDCITDTWYK